VSELNTAALVDLAERRQRKTAPATRSLDFADLHEGTWLAADPSLTGFGLVVLQVRQAQRRYTVLAAGKLTVSPTTATGWEDILQRATIMRSMLQSFFTQHAWLARTADLRVVHEAPPIGHGKLINPEIALLTSYVFRDTAPLGQKMPMVRRQDHAKLICGNANAKKPVHHKALKALFPHLTDTRLVTNEATRDALSVAIYAAHRG
jgi:hypothetical protein